MWLALREELTTAGTPQCAPTLMIACFGLGSIADKERPAHRQRRCKATSAQQSEKTINTIKYYINLIMIEM